MVVVQLMRVRGSDAVGDNYSLRCHVNQLDIALKELYVSEHLAKWIHDVRDV